MSAPHTDIHLRVSLVIPLRDEATTLLELLTSIDRQTRQPDEIVFVDAGSVDSTAAIIAALVSEDPSRRLLSIGPAYPGVARNAGARAASNDYVAFTDGGVRLDPNWLERLCSPVEADPEVDLVLGQYEPITDSAYKECAAIAYVPSYRFVNGLRFRGPTVISSLVRKDLWRRAGGFPASRAAEDLIFLDNAQRGARKVAYSNATAYWHIEGDWIATFRKFAMYSRHNLLVRRERYWHCGVLRYYAAAAALMVLSVTASPLFALVVVLLAIARGVRAAWVKRNSFQFATLAPTRLLGALGVILLLDLATLWGAAKWVISDRMRRLQISTASES